MDRCTLTTGLTDEGTSPMTLVYANISSYKKHAHEVWNFAEQHQADVLMTSETRLRSNFQTAAFDAMDHGYMKPCFSPPRPLKVDGSGPREGGLMATSRGGRALRLVPLNLRDEQLPITQDSMLHLRIPLGAAKKTFPLHVLLVYCRADEEDIREAVFEYAAGLGRTPCVVIGDFNDP